MLMLKWAVNRKTSGVPNDGKSITENQPKKITSTLGHPGFYPMPKLRARMRQPRIPKLLQNLVSLGTSVIKLFSTGYQDECRSLY